MKSRGKSLIIRLGLSLLFLVLFAIVAYAVSAGSAIPFDMVVSSMIQHRESEPLTVISRLVSLLGSVAVLSGLFVMSMAVLFILHRRKPALVLALVMAGAIVLENALKYAFHRSRPVSLLMTAPESYSFPSGHAIFSVCFYVATAAFCTSKFTGCAGRAGLWTCVIMLVIAIGLSRIYLGIHYPSDVIAGYLIAGFWLCSVWAAEPFLPEGLEKC